MIRPEVQPNKVEIAIALDSVAADELEELQARVRKLEQASNLNPDSVDVYDKYVAAKEELDAWMVLHNEVIETFEFMSIGRKAFEDSFTNSA